MSSDLSELLTRCPFEVAAILRDLVALYSHASLMGIPADVLSVPPKFVQDTRPGLEQLERLGLWVVNVEHQSAELVPYFPPHKFWLLHIEHAKLLRKSWAEVHVILLAELAELDEEEDYDDDENEEEDEEGPEEGPEDDGETAIEGAKIVDFASVANVIDAATPHDTESID